MTTKATKQTRTSFKPKTLEDAANELEASINRLHQARINYLESLFTSTVFKRYEEKGEKSKITKYINTLN